MGDQHGSVGSATCPDGQILSHLQELFNMEKRRGWGLFSGVFLQLLENRGIQAALLQDKEVNEAAAIPPVCVPRTGASSASI